MTIDDLDLVQTCLACPEQYDVFSGTELVGYLRLRHGYFRVDVPDCGGETIYEAKSKGDGMFMDEERQHYLGAALEAILAHYNKTDAAQSPSPSK